MLQYNACQQFSWILLLIITVVVFVGGCISHSPKHEEHSVWPHDQPLNILFILADDLGWTDLGCFGSSFYETPNLDQLASRGMRFTNAYSAGPNCAPTRASLMIGLYTPRHGIYTVNSGARGRARFRQLEPAPNETVLAPEFVTITEMLKERGYATGHFGKWHMGEGPTSGPLSQGFDVNIGGVQRGSPRSYFSPYQNETIEDGPAGEYLTDRLADEAIAFIESHYDEPFFVYLSTYAVHTPLQAKTELVEKYKAREPGHGQSNVRYAAMIETLDTNVGRVLDAIEELGLSNQTLVVFFSDNGGLGGYAGLGSRDITSNAPLRGGKGMMYEGGIRVPMIVHAPGVTEPGSASDVPVHTVDFYPTLLSFTSAEPQGIPKVALDGADLSAILTGENPRLDDRALYWHFPGYLEANVEQGTWRTTPASAIRKGRFKLIEFFEDGGRIELYDVVDDIGETQNLVDELPAVARELHDILRQWRETVHAPMPMPKEKSANQ